MVLGYMINKEILVVYLSSRTPASAERTIKHPKTRLLYGIITGTMDSIHGCDPLIVSADNIHGWYESSISMDIRGNCPPIGYM